MEIHRRLNIRFNFLKPSDSPLVPIHLILMYPIVHPICKRYVFRFGIHSRIHQHKTVRQILRFFVAFKHVYNIVAFAVYIACAALEQTIFIVGKQLPDSMFAAIELTVVIAVYESPILLPLFHKIREIFKSVVSKYG